MYNASQIAFTVRINCTQVETQTNLYYMYDYISPEKVMNALLWLKNNNPLYADVEINCNWLKESLSDDVDLFTGLVKQLVKVAIQSCDVQHDNDHVSMEPTTTASNIVFGNNGLTAASNRLQALGKREWFHCP